MSKLQTVVDDSDIEQWYWDEVKKIDVHAQQLEDMLYSRLQHMRKAPEGGSYVNQELGFGPTKRGDIRRAEKCLNHAIVLADYTERISAKSPYNGANAPYSPLTWAGVGFGIVGAILLIVGLFVMGLSSFWVGFGLSVTGLVMLLVGVLIFAGSKRAVFATVAGIALGIFLIAFIILLLVVT